MSNAPYREARNWAHGAAIRAGNKMGEARRAKIRAQQMVEARVAAHLVDDALRLVRLRAQQARANWRTYLYWRRVYRAWEREDWDEVRRLLGTPPGVGVVARVTLDYAAQGRPTTGGTE